MARSDLVRAIENALAQASRYGLDDVDALESWLQSEFQDDAAAKLRALQAYIAAGGERTPSVELFVKSLERELGGVKRPRANETPDPVEAREIHDHLVREGLHPKPKENQMAVKKAKARPRSGFQAAKAEAKASSSKKKPTARKDRPAPTKTVKKGPAPRKPKPKGPPAPRPIYDELVAGQVVRMPRADLVPWPGLNPRTVFDDAELQELADSIKAEGVKVPLVVKLNAKAPHWIAYGERRWRASELAGVGQLPVIVMSLEEREAFLEAVVENAQRSALSPLEEARALERLKAYFPEKKQAELGAILGHADQPWVSNRLRLLKLPRDVQQLADDGIVSATALRDSFLVFYQLKDEGLRLRVWTKARAKVLEVSKQEKQLPLGDDRVQKLVGAAAEDLSFALTEYEPYSPGGTLVTFEQHRKGCDCNGPKFDYGGYMGARVRCFDREWYKATAAKVKARLEAKRDKDQLQRPLGPSSTGAPPLGDRAAATWSWPVKQDVIPKGSRIPPHSLLAYQEGGQWRFDRLADVELLDPELVYQVESQDDEGRPSVDLIYLHSEEKPLRAAQNALTDLVATRVRERRQEAVALELQAIGRSRITAADLVELLAQYDVQEDVENALKELGVEQPSDEEQEDENYDESPRAFFASVDGEVLVRAALLVAHRLRNTPEGQRFNRRHDPVKEEVELAIGRAHLMALFSRLSFIPQVITHTPTEEPGADGRERAGNEEAAGEVEAHDEAEAVGAVG